MPAVEFRVFDRNSGAQLTTLPNAQGRQWQEVHNDTGTGAITLGLADGDLANLAEGNIVRCYIDGVAAFAWVVGPMDQSSVSAEEEAAEERRIVGRGTLGLWADGIVYPETRVTGIGTTFLPLSERRAVDVRRFDFAAADYDDSAWPSALIVPPPPGLDELDGSPLGWPLDSQDWIWTRAKDGAGNHPVGECYFRHVFSVGSTTQTSFYITADNGFELYLDGEMILSEMRTPLLWMHSRSVQVKLTAGSHFIAIKATNHVQDGPINPAGVALVVVALDTSGDPASVVTSTGSAGWKGRDYPPEPPGMTVGLILFKLWQEAQLRGALGGLTLGFTTSHDSAGASWPNAPDVAMPVGTSYLEVIRKLCELYCDVAMDPASLRLDAWVRRGTNRSGSVTFGIGSNITSLSHRGGEQARTNAILGRYADHWLERTSGGRRQESFLELGAASSQSQAQRMIDAAKAERSLPIITTTVGFEPTAGTVPAINFRVADDVSAPNAGLAMAAGRVKSLSVSETEDDYDYVVEIGSIESEIVDRLHRLARKSTSGALDGTFSNAVPISAVTGGGDVTGAAISTAFPDAALNSLVDVVSVPSAPPEAGDFLGFNPDLGMNGMWEPLGVPTVDLGTTVVSETAFSGAAASAGVSDLAAPTDHTHGTPLPRHPQSGYPYIDFSSAHLVMGRTPGELHPSMVGAQDHGSFMRTYVTSPVKAQGWGRGTVDFNGHDDGSAAAYFYNDLDINGSYTSGTVGNPFYLAVQGTVEIQAIENTPAIATAGARLYYNEDLGKLQLSEGGSPYRDIGGSSVELGGTVVAERSFNQTSGAGSAGTASRSDHTHGTPPPFHPSSGYPYVDFGSTPGLLVLWRRSADHLPAMFGTEDLTTNSRAFLTSPVRSNVSGRASVSMHGDVNGTATILFYNDYKTDGTYGPKPPGQTQPPGQPFLVKLTGSLVVEQIEETPPPSLSTEARIYYNKNVGKLQVSENTGAYRDLVGGTEVGSGAAGTFLVSDPGGTHGRRWTGATEVVVANGNLGIGASPGNTLDVVRSAEPSIRVRGTGTNSNAHLNFVSRLGGVDKASTLYTDWEGAFVMLPAKGRLGLNKVNPAVTLDVAGDISVSGNAAIGVAFTSYKLEVAGVIRGQGGTVGGLSIPLRTPEQYAGLFFTEEIPTPPTGPAYTRTVIVGETPQTWDAPVIEFQSKPAECLIWLYNDKKTNGAYSTGGSTNRPLKVLITGDLQVTGTYTGPNNVGSGASGTFLISDPAGTDGRRWTGNTEMTIDANGNVSIGIVSGGNNRLQIRSAADNTYPFKVGPSSGAVAGIYAQDSAGIVNLLLNSTSATTVAIRPAAASYFNGGNVGIGTDNPTSTLTVAGSSRFNGVVLIESTAGAYSAAMMGGEVRAPEHRLYIGSPRQNNGSGFAVLDLWSDTNGSARATFYNDLDVNGAYGDPGTNALAKPFRLELNGTMEFHRIADTPGLSTGSARLYYNHSVGKMQISENGGAYKDLVAANPVGTGSPGSFLVTNTAGTATMWAATSEIYFDDVNNRIGIGATAPQERLAVRDGVAGVLSTFLGPVGGDNSICVGSDKATSQSLHLGFMDGTDIGYVKVFGSSAGLEVLSSGGVRVDGFRVPISGFNNISFGTFLNDSDPQWFFGTLATQAQKSAVGSVGAGLRLVGGVAQAGYARPCLILHDFEAVPYSRGQVSLYNDLKTNGTYGASSSSSDNAGMTVDIHGGDLESSTYQHVVLKVRSKRTRTGISFWTFSSANQIMINEAIGGFQFRNITDAAYVPLAASAFNVNSDAASKENIRSMPGPAAPKLMGLRPVMFEREGAVFMDGSRGSATTHCGLVADEVVPHIPDAVSWLDGKPHGLDYSAITACVVRGFQEHERRIDTLRADLDALAAAVVLKPASRT